MIKFYINLFKKHYLNYKTPLQLNYLYSLGSTALIILSLQITSIIFLALQYANSIKMAFDSVQFIIITIFGYNFQSIPGVGASFPLIILLLHLIKGLWYKLYNKYLSKFFFKINFNKFYNSLQNNKKDIYIKFILINFLLILFWVNMFIVYWIYLLFKASWYFNSLILILNAIKYSILPIWILIWSLRFIYNILRSTKFLTNLNIIYDNDILSNFISQIFRSYLYSYICKLINNFIINNFKKNNLEYYKKVRSLKKFQQFYRLLHCTMFIIINLPFYFLFSILFLFLSNDYKYLYNLFKKNFLFNNKFYIGLEFYIFKKKIRVNTFKIILILILNVFTLIFLFFIFQMTVLYYKTPKSPHAVFYNFKRCFTLYRSKFIDHKGKIVKVHYIKYYCNYYYIFTHSPKLGNISGIKVSDTDLFNNCRKQYIYRYNIDNIKLLKENNFFIIYNNLHPLNLICLNLIKENMHKFN